MDAQNRIPGGGWIDFNSGATPSIVSELPACTMLYLSCTSTMRRPMSRFARSGAVLTETRLTGAEEEDMVDGKRSQ